MSVIAAKIEPTQIKLASDSILVRGWTQEKKTGASAKLCFVNNMHIGAVGKCEESSLLKLFCITHRPERAEENAIVTFMAEFADWKKQRTNEYTLENVYILVIDKKVFQIESFFVAEIDTFTAIGAGQDFALAALYLGHSPKEAVQIACELSVMCEPPIKEYIIER